MGLRDTDEVLKAVLLSAFLKPKIPDVCLPNWRNIFVFLKIYPLAEEEEKGPGAKEVKANLLKGRWGGDGS